MRRIRRFTLIEVLVAVAIFLLVSVALFAFSSGVSRSWEQITVERNRFGELLATDRALDAILSNSIPFMWRDMSDGARKEVPFVIAQPDMLRIAFMHRMNDTREGAIRFAEIYVEDEELRVAYTDRPFLAWEDVDPSWTSISVLATGVESVSFQYADWSGDVSQEWKDRLFWRDEWETEDSGCKDIPLAIMITVTWLDGRQQCWVRRTVGNSFRERYGNYSVPADNNP